MRRGVMFILTAAAGISAGGSSAFAAPQPFDLGPLPAIQTDRSASELSSQHALLSNLISPLFLAQVDEPPNVYPEIMPPGQEQDANSGGVNVGLEVDWLTDYVYRGIDQSTNGHRPENALQFNANASFDLGKLPHPFIGLFVNVFNSDPISRFEEVRPYFGLDWNLRPFDIMVGFNSYIHPNRKNLDTQEVFASVTFDDSVLFHSARPILSPYIYGAYDSDLYQGYYLEGGLKHDFVFDDFGFTLTPKADIAYVINNPYFVSEFSHGRMYGLQHFDVGLVGSFSLNHFFNVNRRYGEWSVKGYLTYTAGIDKQLDSDTLIWGGVGLDFKY